MSTFVIKGDNNSTDTVKIRSGDASDIKVGTFNNSASDIQDLWDNESLSRYVVNAKGIDAFNDNNIDDINGSLDANITITIVDDNGNPAYITNSKIPSGAILLFDDVASSEHFSYELNSSTKTSGTELVVGEDNISTYAIFKISDGDDNITKSQTLSIDFRKGILANSHVQNLRISHMPIIESIKTGHAYIHGSITTSTTKDVKLNRKYSDTSTIAQKDLKIRLSASSQTTSDNEIIQLRFYDPGRDDYLSASSFNAKFKITDDNSSATQPGSARSEDRYGVVDINVTSDPTIVISDSTGGTEYARLIFKDYDGIHAKSNSATVQLLANEGKKVAAYVDVGVLSDDRSDFYPGVEVEFKFSGDAVSNGDDVSIDFNTNSSLGKVGLSSEPFSDDLTNSIKTTMPSSKILRLRLYEANSTGIMYHIKDVRVNNASVNYMTVENDRDTDDVYEWPVDKNITVVRAREEGASVIEIKNSSSSSGDGSDERNLKAIPDLITSSTKKKVIIYDKEILTNTYYNLFDDKNALVIKDAYGNDLEDRVYTDLRAYSIKATDGVDYDNLDYDSWVKFKDSSAGSTQTITVVFDKKPSVFFEIRFTNIVYSALQNTRFDMTMEIGSASYNIVNSEFVLKIKPDGNKEQTDTKLTFKHSDSTANIRVVLSAQRSPAPGREFDSIVDSNYETISSIDGDGSYYIISADKPGTLTITADATIDARDSKTNKEEKVHGEITVKIVEADATRPTINPKTDVSVVGNSIIVKVTDVNLNHVQTQVKLFTQDDVFIKDAVYSNGVFVFSNLPRGTYRIDVKAIDFSNNDYTASFVRNILTGDAAPIAGGTQQSTSTQGTTTGILPGDTSALENILTTKTYRIHGMFFPYDFPDKPSQLDFAYYDYGTNKTYQFQGESPSANNLFGFKEVQLSNVNVQDAYSFYMVQLDGQSGSPDAKGPLGWVIFRKTTLTKVSKLSGATSAGTFSYQSLNLKGVLTGSREVKFIRK